LAKRPLRRVGIALALLTLVAVALGAAALRNPSSAAAPSRGGEAEAELPPALSAKFAALAPPGSKQEGDRGAAVDEWLKHATPGTTIPVAALANARADWNKLDRRSSGSSRWIPLGPTWAKTLPNPFRDRSIYNAGTPDFSGRIAHVAIDPNCGSGRGRSHDDDDDDGGGRDNCRLWIANAAGGGVWRTDNALARSPSWRYLSMEFEHNSTASLELDPNDWRANTLWVGTGEPNTCGSGCEAGVGLYRSTNGGNSWTGPLGKPAFYGRAVGSLQVKPGNSNVIFAASGRALRGLSESCCGGVDALIPGAPHFGLYRSTDGGANWQLVHQGANVLCTASHPDVVSLNQTACSPRGARRVVIDPVDPNTVYVSFYGRGIWRSKASGDPGTWEQIMAPVTPIQPPNPAQGLERPELDVVALPSGESRMYVGVGGGGVFARFRRNDAVRSAPAAAVLGSWVDLTSTAEDTPGYSTYGYCDPQCSYDNYVFAPAAHFPNSGADVNTVYLSGDNTYSENNWGPLSPRYGHEPNCVTTNQESPTNTPPCGRSNARGVALSTNAGAWFTDMSEDDEDDVYPGALHPDHHALTVNPRNWQQFFDVGDGGIVRSNGRFVDDSSDCVDPKGHTGTRLAFCELMLSRVPERLTVMNRGLRTLHFYQIESNPHNPSVIVGGTQDNGSWERGDAWRSGRNGPQFPPHTFGTPRRNCGVSADSGGSDQVWVNTNIADGGHNRFDIGDSCFRLTSFQGGQMMVHYEPKNQTDANWISDSLFNLYGNEQNAFIGTANDDRVHPHWLWTSRQHVFRSTNQGRNPALTKQTHRENCNLWYGDFDLDEDGNQFEHPDDVCDDWKPLGDPGPNGALTSAAFGATKAGSYTSVIERGRDSGTLWAATGGGRVFVSKNVDNPNPAAVVFDRIDDDPTAGATPPRFVTAIYVDPNDPNHAWVTYSGFNTKTPATPGHVFEVRYAPGASTFTMLDGNEPRDELGDIPATSIVAAHGVLYVGTDYGCVKSAGDGDWTECAAGLPRMAVPDLEYVRKQETIYAATHGQGVWSLRLRRSDDDDD
jgi:hypothetical protein